MTTLQHFKPGDRVILARVKVESFRGITGTVKQCIKSRKVVRVTLDRPAADAPKQGIYDAEPGNVDKIDEGSCEWCPAVGGGCIVCRVADLGGEG